MKQNRKPPLFLSLAAGLTLLTGCVSDPDHEASLQAKEAAAKSPLALFSALESQNEELALGILRVKSGQRSLDEAGRTPLMVAARTNSTRVAWELLPEEAASLPKDETGLNALVHAARADEIWLVGELLKRGASPNVFLPGGGTLIAECAAEGRSAATQLLLENGAQINSKDSEGNRLVEIAARQGLVWLVKDLIDRGASFGGAEHLEDDEQIHLSHVAAEAGEPELIEILANRGADLSATNQYGESPVHIAIGSGSFDVLKPLFQQGVSLDAADDSGARPIHLAVMHRDPLSLRELLSLGANPNSPGPEGKLPIEYALEMRDYEFATLLIQYGSITPSTLLYTAIEDGDRNLVDFLLSNGADPNALCRLSDDTPLGLALRKDDRWAAFRLLKAGALPDALIRERQTAFHLAVAKLDRPLVALMLEKGADPNRPFYNYPSDDFLQHVASKNISRSTLGHTRNFTPIAMAADSGDIELARLLLAHGADPNVYTRGGRYNYWAPISWAARRSDVPMMQILLGREPSQIRRRAVVDLSKQRAWVYEGDEQIYTTRVSTGKSGHRTRTGEFVITNRYRNWNSTIYGSSMPYFQRFSCSDFGFHQGYVPGYAASHGCIRVPGGNVRKLWELLSLGDPVTIVN
ncbi:ankyrin repeat domain-containing protein [Roseibacillus persicicus]|uniref:ankyrin repeat domain-containing protein n=1 Tax=Roseibacillus persicicus TaxID=454148 RepID=UPI00280E6927|nr:ankyrin repeat domain-containing protein [Roseibacillus persicicus]MDQ8191980.1 ankyrin repeat domain-containing protein [Roseibacillus persicicus]